jgi:hypothetical protein
MVMWRPERISGVFSKEAILVITGNDKEAASAETASFTLFVCPFI